MQVQQANKCKKNVTRNQNPKRNLGVYANKIALLLVGLWY